MKRGSFVVFDVETTGLSLRHSEIIQFFALKYSDYKVVRELEVYIRQDKPLLPKIVEITGITDQKLEQDGISPQEAWERIKEFCDWQTVFIGHNMFSFDWPLLQIFCERYAPQGEKFAGVYADKLLDTMKIGKYLTPGKKSWPKLSKLCEMLDIEFNEEEAHNARYDVTKTGECVIQLVKRRMVAV